MVTDNKSSISEKPFLFFMSSTHYLFEHTRLRQISGLVKTSAGRNIGGVYIAEISAI
jgi:hypothetical protein